jgi:tetratricopeptide (TPR) repeat protein
LSRRHGSPIPPRGAASRRPHAWRAHGAAAAVLGAVVVVCYANSLDAGFTLDNRLLILEDPRVRDARPESLALVFTQDYWWPRAVSGLYRPLTKLSYFVDFSLLGHADRPAGYHMLNAVLHWGNGVLLYALVLALGGAAVPALVAAALHAAHPIATEAVTNIVGRADLFAGLAVLAATLLHVRPPPAAPWPRAGRRLAVALVVALGVLAKESAIAVAGVFVAVDAARWWAGPGARRASALARAVSDGVRRDGFVLVLPIGMLVWLRHRVYAALPPPEFPFLDNPLVHVDFWTARLTALKVTGLYLQRWLWPAILSCDYSYDQIRLIRWPPAGWPDLTPALVLAGLAGLGVVAARAARRDAVLGAFALFAAVTFLPGANLIVPIGTIMAERLMYLPSMGLAVCVVAAAYKLGARFPRLARTVPALLAALVLAGAARTVARNRDWRDDVTLWTSAVHASPRSFKTHKSLAHVLVARDGPTYPRIDFIIAEAEQALAIMDAARLPLAHQISSVPLDVGVYYGIKAARLAGRGADGAAAARAWYERAVAVLERAVEIDRAVNAANRAREVARGRAAADVADVGNYEVYHHLGLVLAHLGRHGEAAEAFLAMRHLAPNDPAAHLGLARARLATDAAEAAAVSVLQAMALDGGTAEAWRLLGEAYARVAGGGCAVANGQLDLACPVVRPHVCAAYESLVALYVDAKQRALAGQLAQRATATYACPPAPFAAALGAAQSPQARRAR